MRKERFVQNVAIIVLAVAIIVMSVGYATYSTPLKINGTTTVEGAKWDVHFTDPAVTANSNAQSANITTPVHLVSPTEAEFSVTLALGEKYEFTLPVVNAGTIDAQLASATLTVKNGNTVIVDKGNSLSYSNDYLNYTTTWDDDTALATTDVLGTTQLTNTKTMKVSVEYFQPDDASALPETAQTFTFTVDLNFVQSN